MGLTGCTDHLTDHLTLGTHPSLLTGEHTYGDEETDGNRTFSEGEGDTSRATDPESALSPKKKKKGLRTPSFLKKKKKDKKEKDEKKKEKTPA